MKLLQALIPAAALWCTQAAAEAPRLSLWFSEAIGASNAEQCARPAPLDNMKLEALRAQVTHRLDDRDVVLWDPATATWTLRDAGVPARKLAWQLVDRCFMLWIDGKPAAAGVALWTHSARLVSMPVLGVSVEDGALSVRLGADHGGSSSVPVVYERIKEVLKTKTMPGKAMD